MRMVFTQKLLKDWDGRLVLLAYNGRGVVVYDFTDNEKTSDFELQKVIDQCIKDHYMAQTFTLDWKEYLVSEGAGKDIISWKPGKYIREGG